MLTLLSSPTPKTNLLWTLPSISWVSDLALAYPGQSPVVNSRVIASPQHAKAFLRSLADNITRYEARFGSIVEQTPSQIPSSTTDPQNKN